MSKLLTEAIDALHVDKVEIVDERQVKKQLRYISTIRPQRGQKVWQLDLITKEVTEATYVTEGVFDKEGNKANRKLCIKPMHRYCAAINKQNAEKQFYNQLKRELAGA